MRTLSIILLLHPIVIFSQTIENVRFEQQGNQIIIYYDLISKGNKDNFTINIYYTTDYNNNYISPRTLTGDVGSNISAGRQKKVVWNVLNDIDELKGEIKFKVTADKQKKHTFGDYDLFISARTLNDYLPVGGRIGILGPSRIGIYGSIVTGWKKNNEMYKTIMVGGPSVKVVKGETTCFSIYAGAGIYGEDQAKRDIYMDGFCGEGGFIVNLNHINISFGLEFTYNTCAVVGIGFTF